MSEKVLHRVEPTEVMEGWSVKEIDGGPVGFVTVAHYDNGYSVGRDVLVYEFARLAARVSELEAENAKLWADAERWRYCADIGEFPILQHLPDDKRWGMWRQGVRVEAATPEAALDAARAEVKP